MSEHHGNCAVVRGGSIRAKCDCHWPEVRSQERTNLIKYLEKNAEFWKKHSASKNQEDLSKTRQFLLEDIIRAIYRGDHLS